MEEENERHFMKSISHVMRISRLRYGFNDSRNCSLSVDAHLWLCLDKKKNTYADPEDAIQP